MSRLLIVGASARAAAASARRAGLAPWCADLFADTDLRAIAPESVRCPPGQYPHGLAEILRDAPAGPWMYTGALENHPNLVRTLADLRPLWGNCPNALVRCRSPFAVERLLRDADLPAPEARAGDAERPDYCGWLRKPLAGAAGQGITFADPAQPRQPSSRHYYQQFVPGPPMSAVYVRARGDVRLLGVTEQLIGADWLNAPPFRYAGNIGPIDVPPGLRDDLVRVGRAIGDGCDLLGLFGVDFIEREGWPWVVEVNPRYPGSVEVLERATGLVALAHHRTAFDPEAAAATGPATGGPVSGKAILYAPRRLMMPDLATRLPGRDRFSTRHLADIPSPGEVIEPGWPILTVLADGPDRTAGLAALQARAAAVARAIVGGPEEPVSKSGSLYDRINGEISD
jgi:predicted ATP-grasp superfamily ATP-dependent carboligase